MCCKHASIQASTSQPQPEVRLLHGKQELSDDNLMDVEAQAVMAKSPAKAIAALDDPVRTGLGLASPYLRHCFHVIHGTTLLGPEGQDFCLPASRLTN